MTLEEPQKNGHLLSAVLGSASIVAAAVDNVLQNVDIKSKSHDTWSIILSLLLYSGWKRVSCRNLLAC